VFKRPSTGWWLVLIILAVGWAPPLAPDMVNYFSKASYSDEGFAFAYMLFITPICTIAAITLALLNIAYFFFGREEDKSASKS
jgi:hypothetical protein